MERLEQPGEFPACFAFALLKSGSSLMHGMINSICRRLPLPAADIPNFFFHENLPFSAWSDDRSLLELFTDGRVYYGFRALPGFFTPPTIMQQRQCILLVRDPRDALVSQYYSLGGRYLSHKLPAKDPEKFASHYRKTADLEIDQYVIGEAANYRSRMNDYLGAICFRRTLLRHYEEIYFDKQKFLADIFDHFSIEVPSALLVEVARQFDIRPKAERVGEHVRKAMPGDYLEKLKPETIEYLNSYFADASRRIGYDLR